jgi:hypothetical protein
MNPKDSNKKNTYHILVKETLNHHITEWSGDLTLIPQENGGPFLGISFSEQVVLSDFQEQSFDRKIPILSIECVENDNLQEVEA